MKTLRFKAITSAALAVLMVGCVSTQPHSATTTSQPIALQFAAQINGQAFECGKSYSNIGMTKSTITPSDFRFYVSNVSVINAKGESIPVKLAQDGVWQLEDIALLDFENGKGPCRNGTAATNAAIRGSVPVGDYRGVKFEIGVPFNRNHGDSTVAPAPLNSTALFWTWQGGYKFIKFDAASSGRNAPNAPADTNGGGNASGFSVHLGSTVCAAPSRTSAPSACQNSNRIMINFDKFDLANGVIVADMGTVLAKANVDVNATGTSPGCMSFLKDADCPPVMGALGLPYDGLPVQGAQQFLTAR
ncbi:MAG: MbnP family copper-binding protein [Burkholderiaceae bacterium]